MEAVIILKRFAFQRSSKQAWWRLVLAASCICNLLKGNSSTAVEQYAHLNRAKKETIILILLLLLLGVLILSIGSAYLFHTDPNRFWYTSLAVPLSSPYLHIVHLTRQAFGYLRYFKVRLWIILEDFVMNDNDKESPFYSTPFFVNFRRFLHFLFIL